MRVLLRLVFSLVMVALLVPPPSAAAEDTASRDIRAMLDALYLSFSFDAGQQPDWAAMKALLLPGAVFVDPVKPGVPPRGKSTEEFLAGFRHWVETDPKLKNGFRERIVAVRLERYGRIAHAWVSFEGYVPGPAAAKAETRGIDGIQLVLDGKDWKVAGFTTQFEEPQVAIPRNFRLTRTGREWAVQRIRLPDVLGAKAFAARVY